MTFEKSKVRPGREIQDGNTSICPPYGQVAPGKATTTRVEADALRIGFYAAIHAFWEVLVCEWVQELQVHDVGRGRSSVMKFARATSISTAGPIIKPQQNRFTEQVNSRRTCREAVLKSNTKRYYY